MSPEKPTPQHDDEATQQPLSATHGDENPKTHTEVPNRDESDETRNALKSVWTVSGGLPSLGQRR